MKTSRESLLLCLMGTGSFFLLFAQSFGFLSITVAMGPVGLITGILASRRYRRMTASTSVDERDYLLVAQIFSCITVAVYVLFLYLLFLDRRR